jgi:hypothetical protein
MKKVKMETLVFQSKIGSGSLTWDKNQNDQVVRSNSIIIENCTKSVQNWCKKQGFQYKFITEDLNWNYPFKSKNDAQLNRALQNWKHLPQQGYAQIIYLDNDIFILPDTDLPSQVDFGMVPRFGDQVLFAKYYLGEDAMWWNAGVIIMSQNRCKNLCSWMLDKIPNARNSLLFCDQPREESLIAEYCYLNKPTQLDYKWNIMASQTPKPLFKRKEGFLHLLGPDKQKTLNLFPESIKNMVINN